MQPNYSVLTIFIHEDEFRISKFLVLIGYKIREKFRIRTFGIGSYDENINILNIHSYLKDLELITTTTMNLK